MSEHMSPIPSRIYNAAVGGHVCGPEDVDFGQKVVHLVKYNKAGNEVSFESQVTQTNKIYVIHDDFVLSSNVTIPANCVLEFEGGSLSGAYTITGQNTGIEAGLVKVFNTDVTLAGSWNLDYIYIQWFGAVADYDNGGTDNTPYIIAAVKFSNITKIPVFVPASSKYYGISQTNGVDLSNYDFVHIIGAGKGLSVFKIMTNGKAGITGANVNTDVVLKDFSIYGRWNESKSQDTAERPLYFMSKSLLYDGIECKYSRSIAIAGAAILAKVVSCNVEYSVRDGINMSGSIKTMIDNNVVKHCADDGIAVHRNISSGTATDENGNEVFVNGGCLYDVATIITNNFVQDSYGIKCNGATSLIVANNICKLCLYYGIKIGSFENAFPAEANNNIIDIDVHDNIIEGVVTPELFSTGTLGGSGYGILLTSIYPATGAAYNTNTSKFNNPKEKWFKNQSTSSLQNSDEYTPSYNIKIHDNKVLGALAKVTNYSELGCGFHFTYTDYKDYNIETGLGVHDCNVLKYGIYISGGMDNVMVVGNTISSTTFAAVSIASPDSHLVFQHNKILDARAYGFLYEGPATTSLNVELLGNYIDLDNNHVNGSTDSHGKYSTQNILPCLFQFNNTVNTATCFCVVKNNTVKNINRALNGNIPNYIVEDNIIECDVNNTSSSVGHGGVGELSLWTKGNVLFRNLDPTSADYGKYIAGGTTSYVSYRDSLPTGPGLSGQIIINTNPASGVYGWKRVTYGSGNVLGTDWIALTV